MNTGKWCPSCKQYNFYRSFSKDRYTKNGYRSWCKKCINIYHQTEKGKTVRRLATERYIAVYPERKNARNIATRAINKRVLIRQPCEMCGERKSHAHHDDYSKPLEVRWLCERHHIAIRCDSVGGK